MKDNIRLTAASEEEFVKYREVNASKTLDTVLEEMYSYDNQYTFIVTIKAGVNASIAKRHNTIRCNVTIKGGGTSRSKIYISKSVVNVTTGQGDSIIPISGTGDDNRVKVRFENVEFMPVGAEPGKTFVSSTATDFKAEAHLVKLYFASEVVFLNVKSTLENGKITNLDMRACDNVTVTKCDFTNNNGVMADNVTGCIIMVRGNMNNINVVDNTFNKYGNDEIIGFFGSAVPESGYDAAFPPERKNIILRRNIRVTGNTFRYRRPETYAGSGVLRPSKSMDVMISFAGDTYTYWENVWLAYNNIICEDYVVRAIWVELIQNMREEAAFRIFGNTILRNYTRTDANAWSVDFCLSCNGVPAVTQEPIEIAFNKCYSNQTIGKSTYGHNTFLLEGTSVYAHDNLIDGSKFKAMNPYSYQPTGIVVMRTDTYSTHMRFCSNKCNCIAYLAYVDKASDGQELSLTVSRNTVFGYNLSDAANPFYGGSELVFVANAMTTHLRVENNYFATSSYELLLQGFSPKGSIWASGNVWETKKATPSSAQDVCMYINYNTGITFSLEQATCIHNVITGERMLNEIQLPASTSTVIAGNLTL